MDSLDSLFFMRMCLCTFERAHALLVERRVLMDERHPLPVAPEMGHVPLPGDLWTCHVGHTRAPHVGWNLQR